MTFLIASTAYVVVVGVVASTLIDNYERLRLPKSTSVIEGGLCSILALTWPVSVPALLVRKWVQKV